MSPQPRTPLSLRLLAVLSLLLAGNLSAASQPQGAPEAGPALDSEEQKILYALGLAVGQNLAGLNFSAAEFEIVRAGVGDAAMKREPRLSLQEYGPKLQAFAQERLAATAAAAAAGEKVEADKFLSLIHI